MRLCVVWDTNSMPDNCTRKYAKKLAIKAGTEPDSTYRVGDECIRYPVTIIPGTLLFGGHRRKPDRAGTYHCTGFNSWSNGRWSTDRTASPPVKYTADAGASNIAVQTQNLQIPEQETPVSDMDLGYLSDSTLQLGAQLETRIRILDTTGTCWSIQQATKTHHPSRITP